jgi:hypothetical protein
MSYFSPFGSLVGDGFLLVNGSLSRLGLLAVEEGALK